MNFRLVRLVGLLALFDRLGFLFDNLGSFFNHPGSLWLLAFLSINPAACAPQPERAQAISDAFSFAWDAYHQFAFPADEIHPQTNGSGNSRNGWGATAVDSLSTAIIMNNEQAVQQILDFIPTIDFSKSNGDPGADDEVSVFETTIRYLGGMLSAYDLLRLDSTATLAEQAGDDKVNALLQQSVNLANNLSFAFETPSGIPSNTIRLSNRTHAGGNFVPIAACGTLVLEWTRLSDLTGNATYGDLAQKAESYLLNPKPAENEPWPGLIGALIYTDTGLLANSAGGWQSGSDSYYEYALKQSIYDPARFSLYRDRWVTAAESSMQHLASSPTTRPDLTFLAQFQGQELNKRLDELGCFVGGNFILGGTVLGRQDIIDFGLKLVEGCHATYDQTATGIGPFAFGWDEDKVPQNQTQFFRDKGFYINNAVYGLNPEMIESYYYAYQATGDEKYQDWAWDAFLAINKTCRAVSGFASIWDVDSPDGGGMIDFTSSFFFAEVLKYSYLIQAEPGPWSVSSDGKNEFVFNTEGHPIKVFSQQQTSGEQSNGEQTNGAQANGDDKGSASPPKLRSSMTLLAGSLILAFYVLVAGV